MDVLADDCTEPGPPSEDSAQLPVVTTMQESLQRNGNTEEATCDLDLRGLSQSTAKMQHCSTTHVDPDHF